MNTRYSQRRRRGGIAAILAMMFLVIFGALAAAMAIVAQGNLQTAATYQRVNRALAAAETGMHFAMYRTNAIAQAIQISQGEINENLADQLWPTIRDQVIEQFAGDMHTMGQHTLVGETLTLGRIPVGSEPGAPTFQIIFRRHPIGGENYNADRYKVAPYNVNDGTNVYTSNGLAVTKTNPVDGRWIRITSIGEDRGYTRQVQIEFRLDKKIRFALLSRNRVMVGRNVLIKGTIGSKYTLTEHTHGHPVHMRDNFHGLDSQLDGWLDSLSDYMVDNDIDGDNRIRVADERESGALADAESYDVNADGYVDGYDMFVARYDEDGDGNLTAGEFSDASGLIDAQLWQLINELKYPAGTQFDWENLAVKIPGHGDTWQDASADLGVIDNNDDYAKIHGEILMKASQSQWEAGAANGNYRDYFEGPITPGADADALTFAAGDEKFGDYQADAFDVSAYQQAANGNFAEQVAAATSSNGQQPTFTAASNDTIEAVPYKSPHPYDHYKRPIYRNYTFVNVTIPKGTNAVFENCKFIGVTFVETTVDNSDPNFNYAGMLESDGSQKYANVVATVNGQQVADTKPLGNNLRFHNCTIEGMIASTAPQEFTHVRNKIQFTGATNFDLNAASLSAEQKATFKKSTIMAPQYSVDMGTFNDPTSTQEVVKLDGTIVAGVFDIRGQAVIDGSIISTYEPTPGEGVLANGGNPASFNTTIGYFESAAGDGEAEIPDGGYGKIIIRYDPNRALPDGILGPIEIRPDLTTWYEGH